MSYFRLLTAIGLLVTVVGCTKLDDPFEGVTTDKIFTLTLESQPGASEVILPADGRSALKCTVQLKGENTLFSQIVVTAASDDMLLSLTGSAVGATGSLTLSFAGSEAHFYALAPRNFHETVRLNVSSGNIREVAIVKLAEARPNRIDITPAVMQATPGTPFSFVTMLSDTLLAPRAVSGLLPVQFDLLSTTAGSPRLPLGRSVAQADGTATVTTTIILADTGTYRFRARTLGIHSQPFVIRCR